MLVPFVYLAILSTKKRIDILEVPPSLDFDWATIRENYDVVINDDRFLTLIKNSIVVTGVSTLIALVLGVPAAYAFARHKFRGSEDSAFTLLSFRFAPPLLVLLPLTQYFQWLGLANTYIGLIWVYQLICLPLILWIVRG